MPGSQLFKVLLLSSAFLVASAADSPGFRGVSRDGIFLEKGLLKTWPDSGPQELWHYEGLGEGYASVALADGVVFTTGLSDDHGYLYAIDANGKLRYRVGYGKEHHGSGFPGARSTPTLDGPLLFITSGLGKVLAFKSATGEKVWEFDMPARYGGETPRFGYAESLLVDGNRLICTPGGKDAAIVALDKETGKVLWQTKGLDDKASYCSARIFEWNGHRLIITLTASNMVGLDPEQGTVLWQTTYPAQYDIHAINPVFQDNLIYVSDGYKQGGKGFEMAADGKSVKEVWSEKKIDIHHGGSVLIDGHVYGASSSGTWACIDLKTGEIKGMFRDLAKGSVVSADGLLYGYDEKGRVGLIDPDPSNFHVISQFEITRGSGQHWSHPVVNSGKLYIRHGDALMVYNVNK